MIGCHKRFKTRNILKKRLNSFGIYVNLGKGLLDKTVIGINGPEQQVPYQFFNFYNRWEEEQEVI